jgi:hypothetical protein
VFHVRQRHVDGDDTPEEVPTSERDFAARVHAVPASACTHSRCALSTPGIGLPLGTVRHPGSSRTTPGTHLGDLPWDERVDSEWAQALQGDGHDVGRVVHVADPGGRVAPDTPDAAVRNGTGLATTDRSEFGDQPPDYHSESTVLADETRLSDDVRRAVRRTGQSRTAPVVLCPSALVRRGPSLSPMSAPVTRSPPSERIRTSPGTRLILLSDTLWTRGRAHDALRARTSSVTTDPPDPE